MPATEERPELARRDLAAIAAIVGITLVALSTRYGYHRDELYFLQAGRHLAWGYPDQPPLTPLLARLMDELAPHSLLALRLPSALAATSVVFLAGVMARDLGARRNGQVLASASTALCGFVLATGHLLSTATFSLLGWTVVTFLLVRQLTGRGALRGWVLAGLVAGLTIQANILVLALMAAFAMALVVVGPRSWFRQPGPYVAGVVALAIGAPYLIWQARHGFPQIDIAHSIADGGSKTSESRWLLIPFQLLQVGPWLAPIWLTGLVQLWRRPQLRCLTVTYVVLLALFLVLGGKPYYLSGLYPVLFAAGAQPFVDRVRSWVSPAVLLLSTPALVFVLPLLPVRDAGLAVTVNADTGETIGWPSYVDQITTAYERLPRGTAILTDNYGEAGAVDRFGGAQLPAAHSGHNGYASWGPPPGSAPVLTIGMSRAQVGRFCDDVHPMGTLHEVHGIDNDEDGAPLFYCATPTQPWAELWPGLKRFG